MRRNRWIWLGLLILALVAISFYGGPVSYGFFFFVLAVPAVSFLYVIFVYFRFRIYQKCDAKVIVAQTPVTFYYTLQNEDKFAFAGIKTDYYSDFSGLSGLDPETEYELLPHTGIRKQTRLLCKYRGEYPVGVKEVTVTDFLRLFRLTFKPKEIITVTVIPQVVVLDGLSILDELTVSTKDSPVTPTEKDVLVRDYVPGDDIRSINWKLTAAVGKPMVRGWIGEETPAVSIIMDSHRISSAPEDYLPEENKLLETTIALTYYYLERGIRVNIYTYSAGPVCYALDSLDAFEDFYHRMSAFSFSEDSTPEKLFSYTAAVPEIVKSSAVIFVVHELYDASVRQALELEKYAKSTATCLVTDKADRSESVATSGLSHVMEIGYDDRLKEVLR